MLPVSWTARSIKTHQAALKARISEFVSLKDSTLKEAYARGLDFQTEAALSAALNSSSELPARRFNDSEFVRRIAELADEASAEVVAGILDGVSFEVSVVKRADERQRADRYSDVAYDVAVVVNGVSATALEETVVFHLPEFGRDAGAEPYRVDSAHDFRAVADYRKTRFEAGQSSLLGKLVAGRWNGAFYVYAPEHQADDTNCIRSLKVALARAIMSQLPTRTRCSIFRPDGYDWGAWRVEIRLTESQRRFWNGSPFQFEVPKLPKRHFVPPLEFRVGPTQGRFVDGIWKSDLYSNGVEEGKNPTSLASVKRALLERVEQLSLRAGYVGEGRITPVLDDAGKLLGTVKLHNGRHEAWSRWRSTNGPGNVHKFLGAFATLDESVSAIRVSAIRDSQ